MTAIELAHWIVNHRKNDAFPYPLDEIVEEICECASSGVFVCFADDDGTVLGVACGYENNREKVVYVYDVLTIRKDVMKAMLRWFVTKFPGYSIKTKKKNAVRHLNNLDVILERL